MKTATAKPENKFAAILHARHDSTGAESAAVPPAQPRQPTAPIAAASVATEAPKRIRPTGGKGKSSDPNFRQVTAYIPQELHSNATIALRLANQEKIDADKEDFSELLTRLLADWYAKQNYYRPAK